MDRHFRKGNAPRQMGKSIVSFEDGEQAREAYVLRAESAEKISQGKRSAALGMQQKSAVPCKGTGKPRNQYHPASPSLPAPLQGALACFAYPGRRFALPWAGMRCAFKGISESPASCVVDWPLRG